MSQRDKTSVAVTDQYRRGETTSPWQACDRYGVNPDPPSRRWVPLEVAFSAMPEQRYEAGRQTIGALLSTTSPRIEVPEWQRSYSWTTEEIDAFWQDLIAFDSQYPDENIVGEEYFLGSIVLVTGGATNLLLDGQQRLATATILLSVLRDARRDYRGDAAARLQSKYISDFDDGTGTTSYVLTLNLYDREFFRSEIRFSSPFRG